MKKFLVAALLAGGLNGWASVRPDTIVVVNHPQKVTIEKSLSSLSVKVEGRGSDQQYYYSERMETDSSAAFLTKEQRTDNWDFKIPFVGKKKQKMLEKNTTDVCFGGFGFGLVSAVGADDGVKVDMGASFELSMDHLLSIHYNLTHSTYVSAGFGMTWRNYRMTGRNRFIQNVDNLQVGPYPEGAQIDFSRLKVYSLTVPLMLHQYLNRDIVVSFGLVINFNTHASLKTRYVLDGEKVCEKSNNIHHNRLTLDLMAKFRFRTLGLYVKYSPTNVLNTEFGPKFRSLSTGITLFY
ncbi:hypothetical protein, secreted [gut metagenome]|uniref:Outer membrane protein beta-barrel domain-containing protein n=1 Tax=gut metagenome TaxID=749906 RepID=J9GNS9_9ZZZZ